MMLKNCVKVSTAGMSREEWLIHRKKAIGGSDAAAIVGLNAYSSPYEVWADKMGLLSEKKITESMRIGNDLESYVAKRFCEASEKRVHRMNAILYNPDIPFAHANVDRLITGEYAGLECKTTSVMHLNKFRDGKFPPNYYVQCQHYMMVTGFPKWYLAVLVLGKEFLWFEIDRNETDIAALYTAEKNFWRHVTEGSPPETDGTASCTQAVQAMFQESDPETEIDLAPYQKTLEMRERILAQIAELEEQKQACENEIKAYMGNTEQGACSGFRVSWKSAERTGFDAKRYMQEHPEDAGKYVKATRYRTFHVTKI